MSLILYQERNKSIPDDIAKDLKGVLSQLRKHEALVHELAVTEQQVHRERAFITGVLSNCTVEMAIILGVTLY